MYGGIKQKSGYKTLRFTRTPSNPLRYSSFYDLQGGINTLHPSHQIKKNELADAYNCEYTAWGLQTRKGQAKYNATAITGATGIRGLYSSYATGSRFIVCADDKGKIYKDNGTGTLTEIQTGNTADTYYHFHDWLTYLFWVNKDGSLWRYDGSNIDEMTNAPSGLSGILNVENRLFGWTGSDNNLYFSDLKASDSWTPASEYSGFLVVPQVKGDNILACAKQGRSIIVFKGKSIWRYHLPGLPRNWQRELISDGLGIAGRFALDSYQDVIFFMGDDGRIYQLAETLKLISKNIDSPDTSRWGLPTDLNMSKRSQVFMKYLPSKRVLRTFYNDVDATYNYPTKYADYYLTREAWLRGNMSANCMCINDGEDDNGYMYIGSPTTGRIYRIDTGTSDDGTAIDSYFITRAFDLGIVDRRKIFNSAYLSCYPSGDWNATLTEMIDFDATGTNHNVSQTAGGAVWDTGVWDTDVWGGAGLVRARVDLGNNGGYYWQAKLRISTLDKYFNIRGLGLSYQLEEMI